MDTTMAAYLLIMGLLLFAVGLGLPSEYTVTEEKCSIELDHGGCTDQHYYEVDKEKDNTWKPISIGGGGLLAFLGLIFMGEE